MDFSFSDFNFNSVENLPDLEVRAAFTAASVFREDVDIVPTDAAVLSASALGWEAK